MVISIGIRRVHELRREEKGKLAAATTGDARVPGLIDESFVGRIGVLWMAVGLSVANALTAAVLIDAKPVRAR
jgi:hypothetical protein